MCIRDSGCTLNRHIGRASRNCDHRSFGKGLPQRCVVGGSRSQACDLARFDAGASTDGDGIANRHFIRVPDMEDAVTRARRGHQPRVGETEQVEAAGRKLRSSRDLYRREDSLVGWVLGQRPVGNIDALGTCIVELDKCCLLYTSRCV